MPLLCTICGCAYLPQDAHPDDICLPCLDANFRGAQPPLGWAEVEAAALALTPRQVQAMARIAARQRQQEDTP